MFLNEFNLEERESMNDEMARLNRVRQTIRKMMILEAEIDPAKKYEVHFLLKRV